MGLRVRIHPITALISISWVLTTLYMNHVLSAFTLSLILTLFLAVSKTYHDMLGMLKLYMWLVIPPFIILTVMYTPLEALEMSVRLLTLALTFTSTLQLVTPLELTYTLMMLKIPPLTTLVIPIVIKLSEYMSYSVSETLIALKGRGFRGRKLLMNLPIPLVVQTIKSSAQLAETLTQKNFRNFKSVLGKPKVRLADILILTYIAINIPTQLGILQLKNPIL